MPSLAEIGTVVLENITKGQCIFGGVTLLSA